MADVDDAVFKGFDCRDGAFGRAAVEQRGVRGLAFYEALAPGYCIPVHTENTAEPDLPTRPHRSLAKRTNY